NDFSEGKMRNGRWLGAHPKEERPRTVKRLFKTSSDFLQRTSKAFAVFVVSLVTEVGKTGSCPEPKSDRTGRHERNKPE
ncbi:MAG: hypothetical protein VXY07_02450, partial [Planctomycetota bacterium]|nr:hypothetical protein [Planctomycetota bacterium]